MFVAGKHDGYGQQAARPVSETSWIWTPPSTKCACDLVMMVKGQTLLHLHAGLSVHHMTQSYARDLFHSTSMREETSNLKKEHSGGLRGAVA